MAQPHLKIIGHRGASYDAPENTLSAFKLGYHQGADAVELDIHLTKDGRVVVIHDPDTARIAGVPHRVAQRTFEELRQLEVGRWGRWKDKGFSERIPGLEEVLTIIPGGKRLFIEIKCSLEILPELGQVLGRGGKKPEQTVLIGFDLQTMRQAKASFPRLPVFWLVGAGTAGKGYPPVHQLIESAHIANFDGLNLEKGFPIEHEFVRLVHQAGLKLCTWTVDDAEVARRQAAAGVDGIATNRPGWMREQLCQLAG